MRLLLFVRARPPPGGQNLTVVGFTDARLGPDVAAFLVAT